MIQLRELDLITYRAPLALHFTDAATNQPIRDGLIVTAWPLAVVPALPVRQIVRAKKSPNSALYGFLSLPGLEGYQIGDDVVPDSLAYAIHIVDRLGRFLPRIYRQTLPMAEPMVVGITLDSAPSRSAPPGYATVRGDLVRTTAPVGAPATITAQQAAAWARITLTVDGVEVTTYADDRGRFLGLVPLPTILGDTPLSTITWDGTIQVMHNPAAIAADLALLTSTRPDLVDLALKPPFLSTLQAQPTAVLFENVSVADSATRLYELIGAANNTSTPFTIQFGQSSIIQTQIDGDPSNDLSEFLIHN